MTRKCLTPLFSVLVLLATASYAAAQSDTPRAYLTAGGGMTFGNEAGGLAAAGITVAPIQHLQIIGEFGRMSNVMPKATSDQINTAAEGFTGDGTVPFSFTATMPSTYGLGSVRLIGTEHNNLAPFVDGGFGFAMVSTHLTAVQNGTDVSGQLITASDLTQDQTKPLLSLGGGVSILTSKRSAIDIGYHYVRIFTDNQAISTNGVSAGVRVGF